MSLQKPLTVEEALAMACEMRHAITKYGRNATTNHSQSDIREALAALALLAERQKEGDGFVSQAEHTKLKRQYAALNARHTKLAEEKAALSNDYNELRHRMDGLEK
jgi:predicted nuclease with TOPRIM domain